MQSIISLLKQIVHAPSQSVSRADAFQKHVRQACCVRSLRGFTDFYRIQLPELSESPCKKQEGNTIYTVIRMIGRCRFEQLQEHAA
ncbi:unnamed protein product [Litomosoides sigmodontis]|uniref:Uncharacterized protein n=1 Tax=Litomosoides sigmodontis TaxID=42156 RepID=A0A3P6STZ2_LITSI|nr:unnamed protein product [Litomosoides sigmodontis]